MSEMKQMKAADLFKLVGELFEMDSRVWITVTGSSMYPFLKGDRDSVELSKASFEGLKRGDIALIKRDCGDYVLHRVMKKEKDCFYIVGDAQQWVEGPLEPARLVAVVTRFRRKERTFDCSNRFVRIAVQVWLLLIPFRHMIFRMGSFILHLFRKFMGKF